MNRRVLDDSDAPVGHTPSADIELSPSHRKRIARLATEVLAPAPIAATLLCLVAWRTAASPQEAVVWGLIAVVFAALIPIAYVLQGVRKRRLTHRHVPKREQRRLPLIVGISSVFVGLVLISSLGAPKPLVALVASMLAGLLVSLAVTIFWKVSIHTAVVAGAVVILAFTFGPILLVTAPAIALIAWSRVELGDHTPAQVIVGATLGAVVAFTTYPLVLR
jgi:membrane-associated phospholipid phosphatase